MPRPLEIPRKPSIPGFGVVDDQCFRGNIFQCLAPSLSFVELECGVNHWVCFGAPFFKTGRNCICVLEIPRKPCVPGFRGWMVVNASKETFSHVWLCHSPLQNRIAEVIIMFVLGRLASKLAKIAFVFSKFQENQAFQILGHFVACASQQTFHKAWLGRSPFQNWIAEVIIGFVLGCWKSQENQAFQVLGWLTVSASEETFSNAWISHCPQ
jgi:hypothetical protein